MSGTTRASALAAAALLCLSLGLPWTTGTSVSTGPGWFAPSFCTPGWGGEAMSCTPNYFAPSMTVESGPLAGSESSARVFLVGALIAVAVAILRDRRGLLLGAGVAVFAAVLLVGLGPYGGQVAGVAAGVVLVRAARR